MNQKEKEEKFDKDLAKINKRKGFVGDVCNFVGAGMPIAEIIVAMGLDGVSLSDAIKSAAVFNLQVNSTKPDR